MKFACIKTSVQKVHLGICKLHTNSTPSIMRKNPFRKSIKVVLRLRLLLGLVKPSIYCHAASPKSGWQIFVGFIALFLLNFSSQI